MLDFMHACCICTPIQALWLRTDQSCCGIIEATKRQLIPAACTISSDFNVGAHLGTVGVEYIDGSRKT
jgi:hypothetical protein